MQTRPNLLDCRRWLPHQVQPTRVLWVDRSASQRRCATRSIPRACGPNGARWPLGEGSAREWRDGARQSQLPKLLESRGFEDLAYWPAVSLRTRCCLLL